MCGSKGTEEIARELKQDKERTGKVCALQRERRPWRHHPKNGLRAVRRR